MIYLKQLDYLNITWAKTKISSNEEKNYYGNPVYPRTKDYKCKNINCITHKDDKLKEAIYFKKSNINVTYICRLL